MLENTEERILNSGRSNVSDEELRVWTRGTMKHGEGFVVKFYKDYDSKRQAQERKLSLFYT